ncbi:hypothetical protein K7432_000084 [Basidiobolus ranarum]|uniref:Amino acid transporter transmembrane domain-containing protein n=1 Tax=Basidiobolus ranarum TaxID=34480 RepID=A0ABR2WBT9_9FUNG
MDQRPLTSTTHNSYDSVDASETRKPTASEHELFDEGSHGSNLGAYFNLVCIMAGTGILQLPLCLQEGGWIGVFSIILCAAIVYYTGNLLIKCLYVDGTRLNNLSEIGEAAFGSVGKNVVTFFTWTILFGSSALFLILAAENLTVLCRSFLPNWNETTWVIVCALITWPPFVLMKTLKEVAILSFFGAFSTAIMVVVIITLGIVDLPNNLTNSHTFANIGAFPSVLAAIGFSFGGNCVFPHVEHSMKDRKAWPKVYGYSILTVAGMYLSTAIVGYYVYGDHTQSPILLNLPSGAYLTLAIAVITAHVLLTNPILLASLSLEAETRLKIDLAYLSPAREFLYRGLFRTLLIVSAAVIAIKLHFFSDVMTLLGAISNSMLIFVLPVLFNVKLFGVRNMTTRKLIWSGIIILVGTLCCCIGTYQAMNNLIRKVREDQ